MLPRPLALLAPGPSVPERFLRRTPRCADIGPKAELRSEAALRAQSESQGFSELPSSLTLRCCLQTVPLLQRQLMPMNTTDLSGETQSFPFHSGQTESPRGPKFLVENAGQRSGLASQGEKPPQVERVELQGGNPSTTPAFWGSWGVWLGRRRARRAGHSLLATPVTVEPTSCFPLYCAARRCLRSSNHEVEMVTGPLSCGCDKDEMKKYIIKHLQQCLALASAKYLHRYHHHHHPPPPPAHHLYHRCPDFGQTASTLWPSTS